MTEYEYRPMERLLPDGEWKQIWTNGSAGYRAYKTRAGAQSVITRQKRLRDRYESYWADRRPPTQFEYKLQQRPKGDWQDIE